jgi:hypothetical protein
MADIEGILEEVVVKVIGHASRKNAFWLISMDRDCRVNMRNCGTMDPVSSSVDCYLVAAKLAQRPGSSDENLPLFSEALRHSCLP